MTSQWCHHKSFWTLNKSDLHSSGHGGLIKKQFQHVETHHQHTHHLKSSILTKMIKQRKKQTNRETKLTSKFLFLQLRLRAAAWPGGNPGYAAMQMPFSVSLLGGGNQWGLRSKIEFKSGAKVLHRSWGFSPRAMRLACTLTNCFFIASMLRLSQQEVLLPKRKEKGQRVSN